MQDPDASGIGLDTRGVAVDTSHHVVAQPQDDTRLPGPDSQQLNFPPDRAICGNFSLDHIDSFPEQPVRAANQDARDEFSAADLPQAGGGHYFVAYQES